MDEDEFKGCITLEEWFEKMNRPIPWYENIFNFFWYRIPYKVESSWWYVKRFYQRGRYGYGDSDWWSLDYFLAKVIAGGCEKIVNQGNGYPPHMTPQEWSDTLVFIKNTFQRVMDMDDHYEYPSDEDADKLEEDVKKAFALIGENFKWLWD